MLLYKIIEVKKIYPLLIIVMLGFSSCVFTTKEDLNLRKINKIEIEEQLVAQFLVNSTEINFKIINLIEVSKNQVVASDYQQHLMILESSTLNFQNKIKKISENKLVNLPIYNKPVEYKITEKAIIEQIIDQLIAEVLEFEKIKNTIHDEAIIDLKNNYLPEINSNLEKLSNLRVKKYTNN